MRCGAWAKDLCPATPIKTSPMRMRCGARVFPPLPFRWERAALCPPNRRRQTSWLLRDRVGIHLAAGTRTDWLAGRWPNWATRHRTRNWATGHHGARGIAPGRDTEQALSGPRPPRLAPILHETGRPRAHVRCDVGFREWIVNIERPRIGVARTGKNRGQSSIRRASARRNTDCGRQCSDKTYSKTVDHFTILRNGRQVPGRNQLPQLVFVRPPRVPATILPAL